MCKYSSVVRSAQQTLSFQAHPPACTLPHKGHYSLSSTLAMFSCAVSPDPGNTKLLFNNAFCCLLVGGVLGLFFFFSLSICSLISGSSQFCSGPGRMWLTRTPPVCPWGGEAIRPTKRSAPNGRPRPAPAFSADAVSVESENTAAS